MITEDQYLEAKKTIETYKKQLELNILKQRQELLKTKKGDYVTYIGGSKSKYLIKGNRYRLTCSPWRRRIAIINEKGVRMNTTQHFFSV